MVSFSFILHGTSISSTVPKAVVSTQVVSLPAVNSFGCDPQAAEQEHHELCTTRNLQESKQQNDFPQHEQCLNSNRLHGRVNAQNENILLQHTCLSSVVGPFPTSKATLMGAKQG